MDPSESVSKTTIADEPALKTKWASLFFFTTKRHVAFLVLGSLFTVGAGGLVPVLALLLGRIFDAFSKFGEGSLTTDKLMHDISANCIYLLALGMIIWLLQTGHFAFWVAFGELQAKQAREKCFVGLLKRGIGWFEMKKDGISALLPRLQTQIRDLQLATSQPLGCVLQKLITFATALALALYTSWRLTLVTLALIPVCAAVVAIISAKAQPSIQAYETELTRASKLVSNCLTNIDAIKYFNGQKFEAQQYSTKIISASRWYRNENFAQALEISCVRLIIFGMFVQGFWYGNYLVRAGSLTLAGVVTAFWACLQATQAIEDILPHVIVLEKGRASASTLRELVEKAKAHKPVADTPETLAPQFCEGDIQMKNVTFAYPSRPDCYVLKNASFFFPAGETTFVVGRSGSGKSTLANLLMRFYAPDKGDIIIDNTPIQSLNIDWVRNNITLVQQQSYLFNESVFRNIAFGSRDYKNITESQISSSLHFASLHETVRNLPDGLGTVVGVGGSAFSGGQRQRVAIARARLRDTPILILDESTSALDYTSRSTVMDAIRDWRKGKTTIIITHDMSQIKDQDFMYVLHQGQVARKGYRQALEQQAKDTSGSALSAAFGLEDPDFDDQKRADRGSNARSTDKPLALTPHLERSGSLRSLPLSPISPSFQNALSFQAMTRINQGLQTSATLSCDTRPIHQYAETVASAGNIELNKLSRNYESKTDLGLTPSSSCSWSRDFNSESSDSVLHYRKSPNRQRGSRVKKGKPSYFSIWRILLTVIPHLTPRGRILLAGGFIATLIHAAATPSFAFSFAQLLSSYFLPGNRSRVALQWSVTIIGISIVNTVSSFVMHFLLEYCGQAWINSLRSDAVRRILAQPKEWFEREENQAGSLTMCLDRNAEEMRNLVGRFAGFLFVAAVIIIMCIVWGFAVCWKLTLVGLACAPVVYSITRAFEETGSKWEKRCNDSGEVLGGIFSETFLDIKTVRALTLEFHFHRKLDRVNMQTLKLGLKRACYSGFFFGLSNSSIIFVYTLVFYYGAVLASSLEYSTKDILTVFSILLFSLSNVNAALEFVPQISSSLDTASRVLRLATLPATYSHEDKGSIKITNPNPLKFANVNFTYPSRPNQQVLKGLSLTIPANSCTAIVGPSGSGKSTIASLITALYPPTPSPSLYGSPSTITLNGHDINHLHTPTLRSLISIVPQQPTLFPTTIAANISYGLHDPSSPLATPENIRLAAQAAGIDEYISSLPAGYDTVVSDGGLNMSGGQAQRLAIARALVRKPRILILDEATSNLDGHSMEQIRRTVMGLVRMGGMAVVIITHAVEMMEIADKVVVVDGGRVVEEGAYGELMSKRGGRLRAMIRREERTGIGS
ncbi:hypothetical protein AJ79_07067 [Helicocarpus griseus UAMH5409]|uniref:ABC a-pheromone efflux pump AtrD n=1 Tax=Helicocarpus griseus UAMH5409 TaxID=1447875 RepID=A0A2B7X6Z9_9EURO|nr:hypothetical protein AJ79_07067 [Helicocarpus griseus UAMH5409]